MWKEAPGPKNSPIPSTVSLEHRLVTDTDRHTDRQTQDSVAWVKTDEQTEMPFGV